MAAAAFERDFAFWKGEFISAGAKEEGALSFSSETTIGISIIIVKVSVTYDHRLRRIGHPVRSAIHKP